MIIIRIYVNQGTSCVYKNWSHRNLEIWRSMLITISEVVTFESLIVD